MQYGAPFITRERPRSGGRKSSLLILLWLLCAAKASAQYHFDHWTTDDGLPQTSVLALTQTRDGYLWLTTYNGLVRFDGVRFTVFNKNSSPGLIANSCSVLYEDAAGALWIGMVDAGVTRYYNGGFTTYTTAQGVPRGSVRQIQSGPNGDILITTGTGSARWRNGRFEQEPGSEAEFVIHLGRSGTRWSLGQGGVHGRQGAQAVHYPLPYTPVRTRNNILYEDRHGRLWVGVAGYGLLKIEGGAVIDYTTRLGATADPMVQSVFEDQDGTLWFGTGNSGVIRFRDEPNATPIRYAKTEGLSSNTVNVVHRDREGNLWIGTGGGGLNRLAPQFISGYSTAQGLGGNITHSVLADRAGNVWVATHVGLSKITNGVVKNYSAADGLPLAQLQALYEDRAGRLWIGSANGLCWFKDGVFSRVIPNLNVWATLEDRQGNLWVGTHYGLFKFTGGVQTVYTTRDGLPSDTVKAIHEDRQGTLWFGTEGGLVNYQGGRFTAYTAKDGLTSDRVWTIYEDADGTLWLGTYDGGLNRLKDGRFTGYTTAQGLCENTVFQILEDAGGTFWMSCYRGLYSASRRQLNDFADGKLRTVNCASYGKADGMYSIDCNGGRQPSGVKTADGRLWFTTLDGVAVVNPAGKGLNPLPPPVRIEEVKIDNVVAGGGDEVRMLPGQANLEIHYTGLSFIKPGQIYFRYKLIGQDQNWIEAGARRAANYSYLSPGGYTFEVLAANSDGVWNNQGARLRVVVLPAFYQTWWFRLLALLALAGGVGLVFKRRLDQAHRARRAQEEFSRRLIDSQEQERKRIAAELHDSLGQNLLVIKNYALMGLNAAGGAGPAREHLNEISDSATLAIEEVRQIAHNLRPYQLERLGLTDTLRAMPRQIANASDIGFACEVDSIDGLLSKEEEISLYRIVQEAVNNVLKHSGAREASVRVKLVGDEIQLTIADDGRGFRPEPAGPAELQTRGFGLTGSAERVRMLGGKQTIQTAPGQGTTIHIAINIHSNASKQ